MGKYEHLNTLDTVIGDPGFHIFGIHKIDGSIDLLDQRAMYLVLILQVRMGITEKLILMFTPVTQRSGSR